MMKKVVSLFLVIIMLLALVPMTSFADAVIESGKCGDNLTWKLYDNGTLRISGTGKMYDYDVEGTWFEKRNSSWFEKIIVEEGVTSIGKNAFYRGCYVTDIQLPSSLKSIGEYAFHDFGKDANVIIPDSVEKIGKFAFYYANVKKVQLPKNLKTIEESTFEYSGVSSISLPSSITSIGKRAFFATHSLKKLELPSSLKTIGTEAFSASGIQTITIPQSVQNIPNDAFDGCIKLESIEWHDSITNIGNTAFYGCALKEVSIPAAVSTINDYLFENCDQLETITFPEKVKAIGAGVFNNCYKLKAVYFKGNMPTITEPIFSSISLTPYDSSKERAIYYPKGNESWKNFVAMGPHNFMMIPWNPSTGEKFLTEAMNVDDWVQKNAQDSTGTNNGENKEELQFRWSTDDQWQFTNSIGNEIENLEVSKAAGYYISNSDYEKLGSSLHNKGEAFRVFATTKIDNGLEKIDVNNFYNIDGKKIPPAVSEWGGSCFGFSILAYLLKVNALSIQDITSLNANCTHDISKQDGVRSAINYYHRQFRIDSWQNYCDSFMKLSVVKQLETLEEMAGQFKKTGIPVVVAYEWVDMVKKANFWTQTQCSAHAVVAYGVETGPYNIKTKDGRKFTYEKKINIYDCANPNDPQFDIYYTNNYETVQWCIPGHNIVSSTNVDIGEYNEVAQVGNNGALELACNDIDIINSINYVTGEASEAEKMATGKTPKIYTDTYSNYEINYNDVNVSAFGCVKKGSGKEQVNIALEPNYLSGGENSNTSVTVYLPETNEYEIKSSTSLNYTFESNGITVAVRGAEPGDISYGNNGSVNVRMDKASNLQVLVMENGYRTIEFEAQNTKNISINKNKNAMEIQTDNPEALDIYCIDENERVKLDNKKQTTDNENNLFVNVPNDQPEGGNSSKPSKSVNTESDSKTEPKEFLDVQAGKWYTDAVYYCHDKGYMAGKANNKFDPSGKVTRATITQVLYAMEGKPAVKKVAGFKDLKTGSWYVDSVNWAASIGIVSGYSKEKFGPNDAITRQQMAAIMYQYAKYKKYDVSTTGDISKFKDARSITKYAVAPMKWAVGHGIISGTNKGLEPKGTATRAQIAVILQAFDKNIKK